MEQPKGSKFTYADSLALEDRNRYELIDGQFYVLAFPSSAHQRIFRGLFRQLANHLDGKP